MISVFVALRHQEPGGTGGCHDNPLCCIARLQVHSLHGSIEYYSARRMLRVFLDSRSVTFTYSVDGNSCYVTCALPCPGEGNPLHAGRMISPNSSQLPRAGSQEELVIPNFAFRRLCRNPHHEEVSVHTQAIPSQGRSLHLSTRLPRFIALHAGHPGVSRPGGGSTAYSTAYSVTAVGGRGARFPIRSTQDNVCCISMFVEPTLTGLATPLCDDNS